MILAKLRSSAQFLIRVALGIVLLPVIYSAIWLFSLAAICSERQRWPFRWSPATASWDWQWGRGPAGGLPACFSRIRREKHAPRHRPAP